MFQGYRRAVVETVKYIEDVAAADSESLGRDCLVSAAATSISSKIIGAETAFFSNMVVDAMLAVKNVSRSGKVRYPVKAVNVLKAHGKSAGESILVDGYALNCVVSSAAMPRIMRNAVIACLDINFMRVRMRMGIQVLVDDPRQLEDIREKEQAIVRERVQLLVDAGANVILTTQGMDDHALKVMVEAGVMGVRRCKKEDLVRIAKASGGSLVMDMVNVEGEPFFDPKWLGHAEEVVQERLADDELILVKRPKKVSAASIILRGANYFMLDEMERSIHDALCVVKRVLESKKVVPGGGAVEVGASIHLMELAKSITSREQLSIQAFANALLVIPKTLAVNAAQDATELVARLRAKHSAGFQEGTYAGKNFGLDLVDGQVRDCVAAGVLEPAISKLRSIKFATEAATTVLRIDDLIKLTPAEPEEGQGRR